MCWFVILRGERCTYCFGQYGWWFDTRALHKLQNPQKHQRKIIRQKISWLDYATWKKSISCEYVFYWIKIDEFFLDQKAYSWTGGQIANQWTFLFAFEWKKGMMMKMYAKHVLICFKINMQKVSGLTQQKGKMKRNAKNKAINEISTNHQMKRWNEQKGTTNFWINPIW